jgi:hypothetical protein
MVCTYELTRRSENVAQQLASASLKKSGSDDIVLVETLTREGQNSVLWDSSISFNDMTLHNQNVDSAGAKVVVPGLWHQNTSFEWEPDAMCLDKLEVSNCNASLDANSWGSDILFDWFPSVPLPSLISESIISTPADCMFHTPYLVLRPMDLDYSFYSTSMISPRSPFLRTPLSTGSQIGQTFLLQSIQSYATLLETSSTLPLFIHSVSLPTEKPSLPFSAPLEICKSIISLYASKTPATSPFIWRAITMEKDRFMKDFEDVDDWTMLSMLQAVTIYVLLRIFDQDTFSVDFDHELVQAMMVRYYIQDG